MVYVCKFSDDEIVGVLREHEAGAEVGALCRRHNISVRTFYRWKAEHGRVPPSLTVRLKELEEENRRLRALLVEAMLNAQASPARADGAAAEKLSAHPASRRDKTPLASRPTS
ncbi:MAG TPA: transposase [Roseiarcus sp.]|nr:transposase [Roseiarcus sp.]